jgi:hypothetical protein
MFYVLNAGELSSSISSTKIEVQAEARRLADWIVKDVRQTVVWSIANNTPSTSHIKFKPVIGWDTTSNTYLLSSDFIDYTYDSVAKTITRTLIDAGGNVLQTWSFANINAAPFFTRDGLGALIPLNNTIGTTKLMVIVISVQKPARNGTNITASLTTELKVRNE